MKRFNNATIIKSRQRTTIINPLLSLVVVTLMSAPIANANAELIIHSEPNTVNKDVNKIANQHNNKQAPTDVSIIKLMQVMHIDEQIQSIVNGQQAAIDAINMQTQQQAKKGSQQINDKSLNKRQRQLQEQIQSVLGQYAKIMSNGIGDVTDEKTLTQAYISAAKTYYTQAEVDAQIKFYDTEMGQSILAKQPQITAAFLQQSLPEDTSATEAQLGELLPQMKQIIKGIF
ncbi:MAG: DUF2059 domain-containing protein [Psychrobacter sp.]|nr:DUF2059 domain-containing protein [Psychrobacter sp.]